MQVNEKKHIINSIQICESRFGINGRVLHRAVVQKLDTKSFPN